MPTFKLELPQYEKAKNDLVNDEEKTEAKTENKDEAINYNDKKPDAGLPEAVASSKQDNEEDRKKREVILMDGPLSRIYTEALNMVYIKPFNKQMEELERKKLSQESYLTDGGLNMLAENINDATEDDNVNLYVYTTDDKNVSSSLTNSIKSITGLTKRSSSEGVPLYVSVECNSNMSKETLSFINYCNSKNCKLFTNKNNCLRTIISNFKG